MIDKIEKCIKYAKENDCSDFQAVMNVFSLDPAYQKDTDLIYEMCNLMRRHKSYQQ